MKRALLPIIFGAAMLSTAANAAVVVTSQAATNPYTGPAPTYDFDSGPAPVTGGAIVTGTNPSHTTPFGSTGNYLAAGPDVGTPADLVINSFGPVAQLTFLWGSVDQFNLFQLLDAANNVLFEIRGNDSRVRNLADPQPGNVNRLVTFKITDEATQNAVTTARFNSSRNAFEVDNVTIQAVPEPATWMMMILGMIGVGFAMRRRPAEPAMRIRFS